MSILKHHRSTSPRRMRHSLLLLAGVCGFGAAAYVAGCSVPDRTYYDDSAGTGGSAPSDGGSSPDRAGGGGRKNGGAGTAGTMDAAGEAGEASGGDSNSG